MDHVEWGHLLTWTSQEDPRKQKMGVTDYVVGNCNTNKVSLPRQDQRSVKVGRKTHRIVDSQENFDP